MTDNYQTPDAELASENIEDVEYAGFWLRVVASLLDSIIVLIAIMPLYFLVVDFDVILAGGNGGFAGAFVSNILPSILVVAFWIWKGATPGKMILKIRIIDAKTGEKIGAGQSILRYIGYFVSMLPLFLGIIWVAFDKKKQGWHDKIAGVVVVKN